MGISRGYIGAGVFNPRHERKEQLLVCCFYQHGNISVFILGREFINGVGITGILPGYGRLWLVAVATSLR